MSTAEEVMYLDSLGAMRASLSSSTTKEQRVLVDHFLSQLKEDRRCLEIMIHILTFQSENHDDYIRMLSLTILNDWLKIWWNKLSESEQSSIRNTVLMLLNGPLSKSPVRVLLTKLAVMISNIAVRQFPQMWPTFLEDMVSLCLASSTTPSSYGEQEISIMAIEFTASDSIDNDYCSSLPLQRRQDILAGFRKKLPELLGFAFNFLGQCSNRYSSLPAKGSAGPENDNLRAHLLRQMSGLMRMLIPVSMFAKVEDLCESTRDFSIVAVQFLCEPELQSDSVEFLNQIMRHKLPFEVFSRLLELIPRVSAPLLHPVLPAITGGESLPEDIYESLILQRSYAEMVFSLLSENITQATGKYYLQSTPGAHEKLGAYVTLMVNLISQPSWRLAGDMTKEWTKIFREESVENIPWMSDVCTAVLTVYVGKMERILWEKESSPLHSTETVNSTPLDETAAAEFDDHDEWLEYAGALKTQVMSLCAILAPKFPVVCGAFLHNQAVSLLSMPPSPYMGDGNDAADVRKLQAFGSLFEVLSGDLLLSLKEGSGLGSKGSITGAGAGGGGGGEMDVKRLITAQLQEIVERILAWTPASQSALQLQRLVCLQNCSPVLKTGSADLLRRVYANLFSHDCPSFSTSAHNGAVSLTAVSEKASTVIAHLSHACGESAVADPTLLGDIVSQIMNMIAARKTLQPSSPSELKSLQNQRGCLRESLVALSDRLSQNPQQQKELLVMSLADVVGCWQEICSSGAPSLFSSPQALLDACYKSDPAVVSSKDVLGVILSSSKRVSCAPLPEGVWAVDVQTQVNLSSLVSVLDKALPFLAVWQAVFPGLKGVLKTLHGVLEPSVRLGLQGTSSVGLYMPPVSMIRRAVGLVNPSADDPTDGTKTGLSLPGVSEEMVVVGKHLGELRILLYQLLGQACSHRALYVCAEFTEIIADLSGILPWLENYQLSQLMKTFVESFVLNAPTVVHDIVAGFMESFFVTTFSRLGVCWMSVEGQLEAEQALQRHMYRDCSLVQGFGGLDDNQIENAKKTLWSELTRTYGDILASFACCRGFLALDMPTSAAHQSASMLGIVNVTGDNGKGPGGAGRGKKKTALKKPLDTVVTEVSISSDSDAILKQHKVVRRTALTSLLMGNPRYQKAVTAPFVASSVALIGIPDTTASRRGINLGTYLASRCREDRRLVAAVGKDAFSAALSVLLEQEAWSDGIEPEVIEFLATVYEQLVFGETYGPDGSILTPPASTAKPEKAQKGPGFGSMSSWQGPGQGQGQGPGQGLGSRSKSNSNSSMKTNSGTEIKDTAVLTDLPRKVLLMVPTITPQMLESLETQMLGTSSKKKRREYLKEMLRVAGVGRGSAVATGKRPDAAVLDIRQRMAPQLGKKKAFDSANGPNGLSFFAARASFGTLEEELNLTSFFGD